MADTTHVAVIGAGPAGYAAAFRCADLGMNVTLIDKEANPGGVCLYRGCIPSKALLHVAKLIEESKEAAEWGVTFGRPEIDIDKLRAFKESVIAKMTGGLGVLSKNRKINYVRGTAEFQSSTHIKVTDENETVTTVQADKIILASGSRPIMIPLFDIGSDRIMDSTGALALEDIPDKLLVVGGGYIGLELATVYAALGSEVSVVEMLPNLMAGADPDLAKHLIKRLKTKLSEVMVSTRVTGVEETKTGVKVNFEAKDGSRTEKEYDKVLLSIGRRPNAEGMGLEHTMVKVTERGFVEVDSQCRTADPHVLAVGDIAGDPMLAHKGSHEAHVAAEVIAGEKVEFAPRAIPAVVFTDPEIAWCGITEEEAKRDGIPYEAASFPWAASGRATAMGRNDGLTKILVDPDTKAIIGVGIVGSGAGELIGEGTLAVEMGATVEDLALTIHAHPTLSETIMESAEVYLGHCDHYIARKRK